jgi:hypothetical protein
METQQYPDSRNQIFIKSAIRALILLFVALMLLAAILFGWNYFVSQSTITLEPTPSTTIELSMPGTKTKKAKAIVSTSSIRKIRVQEGSYIVKYNGSSDYEPQEKTIFISKPTTLKTPELSLTRNKLNSVLVLETTAIRQALKNSVNISSYQVNSEQLFVRGDWYGSLLVPNSWYKPNMPPDMIPKPVNIYNTQDTVRLILKKEKGRWILAAKPSLVFAIEDYPGIPQEVIRQTNKLDFTN